MIGKRLRERGAKPRFALAFACLLAGCAAAAPGVIAPPRADDRAADLLVPSGHGSLLQDDITLTVRGDGVLLKVTPLEEWVVRLTAPDTWSRLSSLAVAHRDEVVRRTGVERPALFLVSFFGAAPGAAFRPEDVEIVNRGRRLRALLVRPITSGWGEGRVAQGGTQLAVYAFPAEVDLEQALAVEYGDASGSAWEEILQRLEMERSRARARAGLGGR